MSFNDRLERFLRARRGKWIDGIRLASVAGVYAWRSRCSDLRKRGLNIQNRQVRQKNGVVRSEYRLGRRNQGGRAA